MTEGNQGPRHDMKDEINTAVPPRPTIVALLEILQLTTYLPTYLPIYPAHTPSSSPIHHPLFTLQQDNPAVAPHSRQHG